MTIDGENMKNAMIVNDMDNVIVAIEPIRKGDQVTYVCNGEEKSLTAATDIKIYHKLACKPIDMGAPVIKYGEHIGIATKPITVGEHVHVHNVEGHREKIRDM